MANKKPICKFKTGHKKYGGRVKLPKEVKQAKKDNINFYNSIIIDMSKKTVAQIKIIAKDKNQNIIRGYVAKSILQAYKKGEPHRFEMLANRALGKVPNKLKLTKDIPHNIKLVYVGDIKGKHPK